MDTPIKSKKQDSAESEEIQAPTNGKKHKLEEIVFIYKDGKTVKKPVKTGISDDYYIEIISGLSVGDEVISGPYKSISRELEDGSQVVKEEKSNSSKFSKK
jgi:HlyD family secretion protein